MTLRSSLGLFASGALILVSVAAAPALAQGGVVSQLDVRQPDAAGDLNTHLTRLGENPRDINALIGAGEAALALNDPRAATGFFARADEIESGNGRIKAGLGRAMLQLQNPTEALRLFDQAERLRYSSTSYLGDRALARDLTGDQTGAQRDYQAALRDKPNDPELLRRYAVSLGISGQVSASEKVIEPLLYKNDRAAWRNRAFVLAMNGQGQQARDITQKVMPKPLADAIQPYMDRMAGLTPAQRAAAVHFGNFPSNTGVHVAANTMTAPRQATPVPAAQKAPVTSSSTMRSSGSGAGGSQVRLPTTPRAAVTPTALPNANVRIATANPVTRSPVPENSTAVTIRAVPSNTVPQRPSTPVAQAQRSIPAPGASRVPTPVQGPIDPAPSLPSQLASATPRSAPATAPQQPPTQSASQPTPVPSPNPVATRTLADIIRELDVPEAETHSQVAAVDLTEIVARQEQKRQAARAAAEKARRDAASKAKAEADAKAKAIAAEKAKLARNPSRNWVQIGTGQSVSALAFTLRGLRKKHDSLSSKDAFTASWGRTNRLVVGPFASFAKAKDFEATLKKAGADVFAWQSEAGEEVVPAGK